MKKLVLATAEKERGEELLLLWLAQSVAVLMVVAEPPNLMQLPLGMVGVQSNGLLPAIWRLGKLGYVI